MMRLKVHAGVAKGRPAGYSTLPWLKIWFKYLLTGYAHLLAVETTLLIPVAPVRSMLGGRCLLRLAPAAPLRSMLGGRGIFIMSPKQCVCKPLSIDD